MGLTRRDFLGLVARAGAAGAVVAYVPGRILQQYEPGYATGGVLPAGAGMPIPPCRYPFPITPNGGDITVFLEDDTELTLRAHSGPAIESPEDLLEKVANQ